MLPRGVDGLCRSLRGPSSRISKQPREIPTHALYPESRWRSQSSPDRCRRGEGLRRLADPGRSCRGRRLALLSRPKLQRRVDRNGLDEPVARRRTEGRLADRRGIGASSVVVAGDRVVTMGSRKEQNEEVVWCLDADSGRTLWQFSYPSKFDARQFEGGPASTPTIDGRLRLRARLPRTRALPEPRRRPSRVAQASRRRLRRTPLELEVRRVAAGDGGTGDLRHRCRWQLDGRPRQDDRTQSLGHGSDLAGYSTPIPFEHSGGRGVLVFKARAMVAHDLATGRELWRIDWRTNYDCNASTPTVLDDKLFISTGYGGHRARGALFQLGDGEPRQIWLNQDLETRMNSAVVYEGHVYCVSERGSGQLMCFDLRDGAIVWSEPSFAKYGTLMIADGKLIILDEKGDLVIADATPAGYRELARAKVLDGRSWVMPVLANGRIYAKNNAGKIVCLDVRGGQPE